MRVFRAVNASALALGLSALALFAYDWRLSLAVPKSSDQAELLLAGIDMLHGNWRLQGWSMVPDNYWTLDVAFGAILSGLRWVAGRAECAPSTLVLQPALTWTMLCLLAITVAARDRRCWPARLSAAVIFLAACGIPVMSGEAARLVMLSGIHIVSLIVTLVCFMLGRSVLTRPAWKLALAAYGMALLLGLAGDPLVFFIGSLPVLIALPFAEAVSANRRFMLAACTLAASVAGKGAIALNVAAGGFSVDALRVSFAPAASLAANIGVSLHDLLAVFSADFTGRELADAWPELLHLPLLLLACGAAGVWLVRMGHDLRAYRFGKTADLVTLGLAIAAVIDVAALVLSGRIAAENGAMATARYLFPAWVFASVLLCERAAASLPLRLLSVAALAAALLSNGELLAASSGGGALNPSEQQLLQALELQPSKAGLGDYWASALMQVASGNAIRVYPLIAAPDGHLGALNNASRAFTLGDVTAKGFFVIVRKPFAYFGQADVVRDFGKPTAVQELPGFSVMLYDTGRKT